MCGVCVHVTCECMWVCTCKYMCLCECDIYSNKEAVCKPTKVPVFEVFQLCVQLSIKCFFQFIIGYISPVTIEKLPHVYESGTNTFMGFSIHQCNAQTINLVYT